MVFRGHLSGIDIGFLDTFSSDEKRFNAFHHQLTTVYDEACPAVSFNPSLKIDGG